jgi:hypothetical protein
MMERKRLSAMAGVLIPLLVLLLAVHGAVAASSISFGSGSTVGDLGVMLQALVAGDLDNDGDPDLISADGKIVAWQNDGTPFNDAWAQQDVGDSGTTAYSLAIGDLDNDGDLDVASGGAAFTGSEIKVWQNDGTPFDDSWTPTDAGQVDTVYALDAGDLDNDGDLDLVSADGGAEIYVWQNDGKPFDGAWTDQYVGAGGDDAYAVALGDLDNDGDLDIVVGTRANEVIAFENDGTPFSSTWSSTIVAGPPDIVDDVRAVALTDLDGDGGLDVVAGCGSLQTSPVMAWLNPGYPFTSAWVPQEIGQTGEDVYAVVAADWDLDGDPDVASGTDVSTDTEIAAWDNTHGSWSGGGDLEAGDRVTSLVAADLDLDGDDDLVASSLTIIAWPNTRAPQSIGSWTAGPQPDSTDNAFSVALADVNHDSFPDIAAGTSQGVAIWLGNGSYTWERVAKDELPSELQWNDVAWGQINNEAELDLAAASEGGGLGAWLGWEEGTNWDDISDGLPTSGEYEAVTLEHVNHDGLIDLVACGRSAGIRLWQGEGGVSAPYWTHKEDIRLGEDFCDVDLGHVDRNGGLDIASAHCDGGGIDVRLGDGNWGFTAAAAPTTTGTYEAVALGDIDNDGDGDVVAALDGGGVTVWLGDGGSTWTATATISPSLSVLSLDLGDADHDGYLDILAGYDGGVRVWLGDGGTSWTDTSTSLPDTGGAYYGVAFGRIDTDALLDIAGAEVGSSGVHVWTAVEPPPGGWRNPGAEPLSATGWVVSQVASATVEVTDVGSGLNVDSAAYCFSTDGSACAGDDAWLPATCTGISGTTSYQTLTAASINFGQDSDTDNVVQFRISDTVGYAGISPIYRLRIDTTPPTNPTDLASPGHVPAYWSNDNSIHFTWSDEGDDNLSGVDGYSYLISLDPEEDPDGIIDHDVGTGDIYQDAIPDGRYYFHFRTGDHAGNWSDSLHLGQYKIDTQGPSTPVLVSSDPITGVWTSDYIVDVDWESSDGAGSGVYGYSLAWDSHPIWVDFDTETTLSRIQDEPLADGEWYLNIRAVDNVGNGSDVAHFGPFLIDRSSPTDCWIDAPAVSNSPSFQVQWLYLDATSGVASYDVQVRDGASGSWTDWQMGTTDTSAIYTGAQNAHTYYFQVRAHDQAGNPTVYICQDHTTVELPPGIATFSPTSGFQSTGEDDPPLQLVPGTRVVISGTAFTGGTAYFNGVAMEPSRSQVVDDTRIEAVVGVDTPLGWGPVCVRTPIGEGCSEEEFHIVVRSYPARTGLGFDNFGTSRRGMNWDIFERAFGDCGVNCCAVGYLGIPWPCEFCPEWARVPRPDAAIFFAASRGIADGGDCYGISYMTLDFETRRVLPDSFAAGASIPGNLSWETPRLADEIRVRQWRQLSAEALGAFSAQILHYELFTPGGMKLYLEGLWALGERAVICMKTGLAGHCVVPYDIVGDDIYIYDNNFPYVNNNWPEETPPNCVRSDYLEAAMERRYHLTINTWEIPDPTTCDSTEWQGWHPGDYFIAIPYTVMRVSHTPLSELTGLGAIFGSNGAGHTHLEDAEGGFVGYDENGHFTRTITTAIPILPFTDGPAPFEGYFASEPGDYSVHVSGTTTGSYSMTVFAESGSGLALEDLSLGPETQDVLAFKRAGAAGAMGGIASASESTFALSTNDASKALNATLLRTVDGGNEERSYALEGLALGSGAPFSLTTESNADSVVIAGGLGSSYRFCLYDQAAGYVPSEFCWNGIDHQASDRHILTPEDWDQLNSTRVRLDVDHGNDGSIDETRWLVGHGLALAMDLDPLTIESGDLLTLTLAYRVSGEEIAPGIVLSTTVPLSTTFVSASAGVTPVDGVLTWTLGDLAPGANGQVAFTVQLDPIPNDAIVGTMAYLRDTSGRWAMASGVAVGPEWHRYRLYLPLVTRNHAP